MNKMRTVKSPFQVASRYYHNGKYDPVVMGMIWNTGLSGIQCKQDVKAATTAWRAAEQGHRVWLTRETQHPFTWVWLLPRKENANG